MPCISADENQQNRFYYRFRIFLASLGPAVCCSKAAAATTTESVRNICLDDVNPHRDDGQKANRAHLLEPFRSLYLVVIDFDGWPLSC